jgi:UDP:flavonoid glycosyltransferase YjiC (YdhE family)
MGSLSSGYSGSCRPFYEQLVKAIEKLSNVVLLIASDSIAEINNQVNVFCLPSVPQTDILKISDLFIFHGGMGSLNEAIANEVPMLVYPMNKEGDNLGDAARVCFHGLGKQGDMLDGSLKIEKIIQTMLDNLSVFQSNCRKFKEANPYHDEKAFLDLIMS